MTQQSLDGKNTKYDSNKIHNSIITKVKSTKKAKELGKMTRKLAISTYFQQGDWKINCAAEIQTGSAAQFIFQSPC
jgi:hypothetical protein